MTDQDRKLCERCNERAATSTICNVSTGMSEHLCEPCSRELASAEDLAFTDDLRQIIRTGKCRFCGQPAVGGSGGSLGALIGAEPFLWCDACRRDLVEFWQRPENKISELPFDNEAAQERFSKQFAESERRQEEFMKQRVMERKSKNDG